MKTVVCIGEILWDIYPGRRYLGGAPLNAAVHLAKLGEKPYMISAVGRDELGRSALERLGQLGVDTRFVASNDRPTGTAVVHPELEGDERFDLPENAAYDLTELSEADLAALTRLSPDAAVFGSLAQKRSKSMAESVGRLLAAMPNAEKLFDVNLRKQLYDEDIVAASIERCGIFKLNEDEVDTISLLLFDEVMPADRFARFVFSDFPCHTVVVTRGGRGAVAYGRDGETVCADAIPVAVVDTVGAGDAFSAGYLSAWLRTRDRSAALRAGNENGARTAAHAGAF